MSNEYFDNTQNRITNGTTARAPDVNNVIDATAAAFDLLPDPQSIWGDRETVGLCGGTANAILLTIGGQTPIPYQDGQGAIFQKLNGNNTGACTLAIDSGSPKPLVNFNEEELVAGDLVNRRWYHVRYDAADDRWMIVNQITVGALDAAVASAASSATDALNYASSASAASIAAWNQKGYAEEWAQAAEDTPVSVAAGGDGATDFSALHWAAKAADTVAGAVIKAATGPQAIYGAGVSDALGADAGSLTISTGDSGVTSPGASADDLIIEGSGNTGITIATPNTANGQIRWNDPEDAIAAMFRFSHADERFDWTIHSGSYMFLNETGLVTRSSAADEPPQGGQAGSVTISTGDSGVTTFNLGYDDLIVESDAGANGITIASRNTGFGGLHFADPEDPDAGAINYSHSADAMVFKVANANALRLNSSTGNYFGDGPDLLGAEFGSLTISTGDSGVTSVSANADELVVESDGNVGMLLASPNDALGQIRFADPDGGNMGAIKYNHASDFLGFVAGGADVGRFDALGRFIMTGSGTESDALGAESGSVTISTGDSGVSTINADADELVIESDGNAGISILTANTGFGSVRFGDADDNDVGSITYNHNAEKMNLVVGTNATVEVHPDELRVTKGSNIFLEGDDTGGVKARVIWDNEDSTGTQGAGYVQMSADRFQLGVCESDFASFNHGIVMYSDDAGLGLDSTQLRGASGAVFFTVGDDGAGIVGEKLVVSSATIRTTDATKVQFNVPIAYPTLTTTERDALTPAAGWTIFNTTTSKIETYDGSTWQAHW